MLYQKYSTARMDASMSVKTYGHTRINVSSYKKDNLCFERWQAARCFFTGCDRVRCISAHAGGLGGLGWGGVGKKGVSPQGATSSPVLS